MTSLELFDVARTTEFELELGDESFRVRVELTHSRQLATRYRANVWRTELYRIRPSVSQRTDKPANQDADEYLWVGWTSMLREYGDSFTAASLGEAESLVLDEIRAWIRHTTGECDSSEHTWGECS